MVSPHVSAQGSLSLLANMASQGLGTTSTSVLLLMKEENLGLLYSRASTRIYIHLTSRAQACSVQICLICKGHWVRGTHLRRGQAGTVHISGLFLNLVFTSHPSEIAILASSSRPISRRSESMKPEQRFHF